MSTDTLSRQEMAEQALNRAVSGQSAMNYGPIYDGFMARGIPMADILPRENVFTYHAWRALGRQVRRGEHGVKVTTFVPMTKKSEGRRDRRRKESADRPARPDSRRIPHFPN